MAVIDEEAPVQTILAFAFHRDVSADRVRIGLDRVEEWYRPLWPEHWTGEHAAGSRAGVQLWDVADPGCRWPAWSQQGTEVVATTSVPLGYQQLVGELELDRAPVALAARLRRVPSDVLRLTAPFVLVSFDRGTEHLSLLTDGLGIGRLYQLRTDEGWFWSNRPVAALRFAGVRAEADPVAWRRMAACDWPMGDHTPYRGVCTVPAATRIDVDAAGPRQQSVDVLSSLIRSRREPLSPASLARTAEALVDQARAIHALWPGVPVLSLSGGRDSRLVVAAFVAAGIEVTLKTYGADGEADTARRLVELLPGPVEHVVTIPAAQRPGRRRVGAYDRARRWHDVTEGLRPALYLRSTPPRRLLRHQPPLISGVGGEFGHAPGYPDDAVQLEQLPAERRLDAFARSLQAKIVLPRGPSGPAEQEVAAQIRRVLEHAAARDVTDSKALDWFYADERLRRWGLAGESFGRVMPLLAPEFIAAAFGLSTAESNDSALHSALIGRLVPAWAGVGFYSATLKQRQNVRQLRLWEEEDVDRLSGVFSDPTSWGDAFDVNQVQAVWRRALVGRAAARDELLLQRVVWRAAFADHLAAVNGDALPVGEAPAPARADRPLGYLARADLGRVVRSMAAVANDVPWARRMARTPLGRRLRRRLGV